MLVRHAKQNKYKALDGAVYTGLIFFFFFKIAPELKNKIK